MRVIDVAAFAVCDNRFRRPYENKFSTAAASVIAHGSLLRAKWEAII
jgi:hypothetical protein